MSTNQNSRREFLVILGTVTLGQFLLPQIDQPEAHLPPVVLPNGEIEPPRVRQLASAPIWMDFLRLPTLMWAERVDGEPNARFMIWRLETAADLAEGQRLVEAAKRAAASEG